MSRIEALGLNGNPFLVKELKSDFLAGKPVFSYFIMTSDTEQFLVDNHVNYGNGPECFTNILFISPNPK